ncbi:polysaccharide deacetylase family protein [uncultured Enterovirga sp.]|uniref:polysaccharide deacetylase family protein n=1 Tax=uncultured Enterovirga sp. TaxID=2026352 RepID=UPI0035CAC2B8
MRRLTLSFDNGPEPDVTPYVLDVLAERGLKATFFLVGEKLREPGRRALAERAHAEGHWIGNHTYTHSVPLGLRSEPEAAENEIGRTQELIGDLAHPDRLFRPFGGEGRIGRHLLSRDAVDHLVSSGYSLVLWNAIPRDWEPEGWVERALDQVAAQDETLLVLHDLPGGGMRDLERFLDRVEEAGAVIRQEIPASLMPIRRGRVALPIAAYVGDGRSPVQPDENRQIIARGPER